MGKTTTTIGFLLNTGLSVLFATLWMKSIKQQLQFTSPTDGSVEQQYVCLIDQFRTFHRDILSLSSVQKIISLLSIYMFLVFVVKSICESLIEYFKFKLQKFAKCLYNIVESMLLYTMILGFFILSMYITNYQVEQQDIQVDMISIKQTSIKYSQRLIFVILETFLYGRILFTVGYLVGVWTELESFRAYGVALTMVSVVIALSSLYDFNIWGYF